MSHHARPAGTGHEDDRTSVRGILIFAALTLALVGVAGVVAAVQMKMQRSAQPDRYESNAPPEVADIPDRVVGWAKPGVELQTIRARESERLEGYGWIDRDTGVVRIPIDRAMQLLAGSTTKPAEETR